jgi:Vacuolar protein 14 C-terminal Fig4p binding
VFYKANFIWKHSDIICVVLNQLNISGSLEVTVEFLIEIDKLVQLIESPIFTCE